MKLANAIVMLQTETEKNSKNNKKEMENGRQDKRRARNFSQEKSNFDESWETTARRRGASNLLLKLLSRFLYLSFKLCGLSSIPYPLFSCHFPIDFSLCAKQFVLPSFRGQLVGNEQQVAPSPPVRMCNSLRIHCRHDSKKKRQRIELKAREREF